MKWIMQKYDRKLYYKHWPSFYLAAVKEKNFHNWQSDGLIVHYVGQNITFQSTGKTLV